MHHLTLPYGMHHSIYLHHASSEHVKIIRGEVEDVAHFAESAKRLWSTKNITFAEQIGRDSLSAPDRFELTELLLGE